MTFRDQDLRSRLQDQVRGEIEKRLSKMCLETVSRPETGLENSISNFYKQTHESCSLLVPNDFVKTLGVVFDDRLSLEKHINRMVCTCYAHLCNLAEVESSRTSSRTHFEVLGLGLGLEGQVLGLGLGLEASSPRKLPCPRLEDNTIF